MTSVTAYLNPFDLGEGLKAEAPEGQSVLDIMGGDLPGYRVMIGPYEIPRESWRHTHPKAGQTVRIYAMPQDGGTLRSVALVAVTAAAAVSGGALGPAGAQLGATFASGGLGATIGATAIAYCGPLAINQEIAP